MDTNGNTKELIKDLCSRLPYGVIVKDRNGVHKLTAGNTEFTDLLYNDKCNIKPYLFPLANITEEQEKEYLNTCNGYCNYYWTEETFDWEGDEEIFISEEECSKSFIKPKILGCNENEEVLPNL